MVGLQNSMNQVVSHLQMVNLHLPLNVLTAIINNNPPLSYLVL